MSVIWKLADEVLHLKLVGPHTASELREAVNEALEDPQFRPGIPVLLDARSSIMYARTPEALWSKISLFASLPSLGFAARCAAVCIRVDQGKTIIEKIADGANRSGIDFQIFESMGAALKWLETQDQHFTKAN